MRPREADPLSLALLAALVLGCAPKPPPAAPPAQVEIVIAPTSASAASAAPPAGPLLQGLCFVSVADASGYVFEPTEDKGDGPRGVDVHAIEACYTGFVQAHPHAGHGLPGWARFFTKSGVSEAVEIVSLEDSGLPDPLRTCLATALARTTFTTGPTVKHVYLTFR